MTYSKSVPAPAGSAGAQSAKKNTRANERRRAYAPVRRGGFSVREVAEYFGRDTTTISSLMSRYEHKVQNQPKLGRELGKLYQIV